MHWWFGHVFINRDLPVPTQAAPEKSKKPSWLGNLIHQSLTLLTQKIKKRAELYQLRSQHRHLSDHLLQDIGRTRSEWDQMIAGKKVARQPESAPKQQPAEAVETETPTIIHRRTNSSKPVKKASRTFDDSELCCTA